MSDWISREDALEILEDEGWVGDSLRRIHALPAVQSEVRQKMKCFRCGGSGERQTDYMPFTCGRCDGTGFLNEDDPCAQKAVHPDVARLRKLLDDIIDEYDGHMFGPIMTSINAARAELEGA